MYDINIFFTTEMMEFEQHYLLTITCPVIGTRSLSGDNVLEKK